MTSSAAAKTRKFLQAEADRLLPEAGIHIVLWGDDPLDSVTDITGRVLHLNDHNLTRLRHRLEHDAAFRNSTVLYDFLADYNAHSRDSSSTGVFIRDTKVQLICLNINDNSALALKLSGIIPSGYPDFAVDVPALNYQIFSHEIGHVALDDILGIEERLDNDTLYRQQIVHGIKNICGIAVKEKDAELFQERACDLFSCALTAWHLKRPVSDVSCMVSRIRMVGIVAAYSKAPPEAIHALDYLPPIHYTSPVLDKLGTRLNRFPKSDQAFALMRECLNLCAENYSSKENAENIFKTAHKLGIFSQTVDRRFVAAKQLLCTRRQDTSLAATKKFAVRYVSAEKKMLDLCRKGEKDPAALKKLTFIRRELARSLGAKRSASQKKNGIFNRLFGCG